VTRARAAAGSAAFFVLAPGVVAGLIPWLLTGWETGERDWRVVRATGVALVAAGALVLVPAFLRFVREGVGTPAPVAPPAHLVVGGVYRLVRNPMYLAVEAVIVGQALVLGRLVLLAYAAVVGAAFAAFVRWYEEPALERRFGAEYEEYRQAVPAWRPRLRPWEPGKGRPVGGGDSETTY
jgi:protein-S-isoprenylcysteine O-methyltransferase Ste14